MQFDINSDKIRLNYKQGEVIMLKKLIALLTVFMLSLTLIFGLVGCNNCGSCAGGGNGGGDDGLPEEPNETYTREENYIYIGRYPQSLKEESVTITDKQNKKGYYLGSDNEYYAKVVANPRYNNYRFKNNEKIIKDEIYYFKVEPIKWSILNEKDGKAFLRCVTILTKKGFDDDSNIYKDSQIRAWLNGEFYSTVFNSLQQNLILTTEVDNSARSTNPNDYAHWYNDGNNSRASENTFDKVFLLSLQELTTIAYGFSKHANDQSNPAGGRRLSVTDYGRATGVFMDDTSRTYGIGAYWTRSPEYYTDDTAYIVQPYGHVSVGYSVDSDYFSPVPAMWINLEDGSN